MAAQFRSLDMSRSPATMWNGMASQHGALCGCLLSCGLDGEMHDGQTLDNVLDQIDMSDVD
jgi:hypothetical protein